VTVREPGWQAAIPGRSDSQCASAASRCGSSIHLTDVSVNVRSGEVADLVDREHGAKRHLDAYGCTVLGGDSSQRLRERLSARPQLRHRFSSRRFGRRLEHRERLDLVGKLHRRELLSESLGALNVHVRDVAPQDTRQELGRERYVPTDLGCVPPLRWIACCRAVAKRLKPPQHLTEGLLERRLNPLHPVVVLCHLALPFQMEALPYRASLRSGVV